MSAVAPVDPAVFFYTYSTIAQALGGAFGFMAAIVLYQLQALNSQMRELAARLMDDPARFNIEPYRTLFIHHDWKHFLKNLQRDADPAHPNPTFKNLSFLDLGAMEHTYSKAQSIRTWFLVSMLATIVCISLALIAMVLMASLQSMALLITLVAFGIGCLGVFGRLMWVALKS